MSDTPIYDEMRARYPGMDDIPDLGGGDGLTYSRFVADDAPPWALTETEAHVRAHLSSIADTDDDPTTRAADVQITRRPAAGGVLVVGFLPGGRPTAPYLQPGYTPDADRTGYTFRRWVPRDVIE